MTTAQIVFAIALGSIAVLIMAFGAYVVSSTIWSNRWVRPLPRTRDGDR